MSKARNAIPVESVKSAYLCLYRYTFFLRCGILGSLESRSKSSFRELGAVSRRNFVCFPSWIQLHVLNMRARGLAFASSISCLASFSSSWGGSKEILMVSVSKKGLEVWRMSEKRWYSLRRADKWLGSKGVGVFILDVLGGVIKEENLGRGRFGFSGAV